MTWEADEKRRYQEYQVLESWRHDVRLQGDRPRAAIIVIIISLLLGSLVLFGLFKFL